ncbi:helix-turn-helix transcriptional regulator [Geoalkalibacter halelectricus]|uniref:Transcriptional regulator n=1 Tax=Geoalkalibacter halelectricus TaxID=2847045 RepID=A0ABY5ZG27_9BACT|nr:transcriptional regulator [Geoalkalibacter halelectricus]MDO3379529.1 transcriptional regulator [Geoalkalibacter halelectricus]UWZ78118.1 transcriptional regulator [Geoalkalibacter halelectricus]
MGKPAKKYSQAARLHDVIRILEARYGASVDELAEECQVNRRTIYRDLRAIAEAGYPLVRDETESGPLYRFVTGFKNVPPIIFSLEELLTLYFCREQLGFLQGTPFQDDLDAIFGRIRSSLPPRSVAHLERIASAAAPRFQGVRNYQDKKALLTDLRRALLYQYRCRICYAPARRAAQTYEFDPYLLIFYQNSLYLGGYAHNRKSLRLFLVDRVQRVEVLNERFEVPEDFRAEDLTGQAFGLIDDAPLDLDLRFGPEVAHFIRERRWHPQQVLDEESDGGVRLRFTAAGRAEILAWVYSFIPHVEILGPADLRAEFEQGLRQALEKTNSSL